MLILGHSAVNLGIMSHSRIVWPSDHQSWSWESGGGSFMRPFSNVRLEILSKLKDGDCKPKCSNFEKFCSMLAAVLCIQEYWVPCVQKYKWCTLSFVLFSECLSRSSRTFLPGHSTAAHGGVEAAWGMDQMWCGHHVTVKHMKRRVVQGNTRHIVSHSTASSYASNAYDGWFAPILVIVWEWHIGLALLCGCSGALEYPTTNSCGPINESLSFVTLQFLTRNINLCMLDWGCTLCLSNIGSSTEKRICVAYILLVLDITVPQIVTPNKVFLSISLFQ